MQARPIVVFRLGQLRFGLELAAVEQLIRLSSFRPLPGALGVVAGTIELAGHCLPLLDIRVLFGLGRRDPVPGDRLLLVRSAGQRLALVAEGLEGLVHEVRHARQRPDLRYVRGVLALDGGLLLIQELDSFLSPRERCELGKALERRQRQGTEPPVEARS